MTNCEYAYKCGISANTCGEEKYYCARFKLFRQEAFVKLAEAFIERDAIESNDIGLVARASIQTVKITGSNLRESWNEGKTV